MPSLMTVVTCSKCRAWYNMDFEPHLDDDHFNPRTGEPCHAGDEGWDLRTVYYRVDWQIAY